MTWRKEVMPVCPPALTKKPCRLGTRFDSHFRNPTLLLPVREVFADEILYDLFPLEIVSCHGPKFVIELSSGGFAPHPVDSVNALLENIIWTRLKVSLFPQAKLVTR